MADKEFTIEVLIKARDAASTALNKLASDVEGLGKNFDNLGQKSKQLDNNLKGINNRLDPMNQRLKEFSSQLRVAGNRMGSFNQASKDAAASARRLDTNLNTLNENVKKLNANMRKNDEGFRSMGTSARSAGESTKRTGDQLRDLQKELVRAEERSKSYGNSISGLTLKLNALEQALDRTKNQDKRDNTSQRIADTEKLITELRGRKNAEEANIAALNKQILANKSATDSERARASALGDTSRASKSAASSIDEVGRASRSTDRDVKGVDSSLKEIARTSDDVDRSSRRAGGGFQAVGQGAREANVNVRNLNAQFNDFQIAVIVKYAQALGSALVSVGGELVSVGASALDAGAAIGGGLTSGIAEALPVIGILGAALSRLKLVQQAFKLEQTQQLLQAHNQGRKGNQLANDASSIASANDTLINSEQSLVKAHQSVTDAQIALTKARADAVRQIQDLVTAEKQAKLAAEGSSLAEEDAQRKLRAAEAGGSTSAIAQARLDLKGARLTSSTDKQASSRATVDLNAARSSSPTSSVTIGLVQANRALVDAQQQVASSSRAVISAQRGVADAHRRTGFQTDQNTAAQDRLAAMLSQNMSAAERSLYKTLLKLNQDWVHFGTHITDPVINSVNHLATRFDEVLRNPKLMAPFVSLSKTIGSQMNRVIDFLFSPRLMTFWSEMARNAQKDLPSITTMLMHLADAFVNIARAGRPIWELLLHTLEAWAGHFDSVTQNTGKLNSFMGQAKTNLQAWLDLISAVGHVISAIFLPAAKEGGNQIEGWAKNLDKFAANLRSHSAEVTKFFKDSGITFNQILSVIGALVVELAKAFAPDTTKAFADVLKRIVIPALGDAVRLMGFFTQIFHQLISLAPAAFFIRMAAEIVIVGKGFAILVKTFKELKELFTEFFVIGASGGGSIVAVFKLFTVLAVVAAQVKPLRDLFGGLVELMKQDPGVALALTTLFVGLQLKYKFITIAVEAIRGAVRGLFESWGLVKEQAAGATASMEEEAVSVETVVTDLTAAITRLTATIDGMAESWGLVKVQATEAAVAMEEASVAGAGASARGAAGAAGSVGVVGGLGRGVGIGSKLIRGGLIGSGIALGGDLLGSTVGGKGGSILSGVGTGAGLGVTAGSVFGVPGMLIGGATGGVIGALVTWLGKGKSALDKFKSSFSSTFQNAADAANVGALEKLANQAADFASKATGGNKQTLIQDSLQASTTALNDLVAQGNISGVESLARQMGNLATKTGDASGAFGNLSLEALVAGAKLREAAIGRSTETELLNLTTVTKRTVGPIIKQLQTLSPAARAETKTMLVRMAKEMEANGDLPHGSAKQLNRLIRQGLDAPGIGARAGRQIDKFLGSHLLIDAEAAFGDSLSAFAKWFEKELWKKFGGPGPAPGGGVFIPMQQLFLTPGAPPTAPKNPFPGGKLFNPPPTSPGAPIPPGVSHAPPLNVNPNPSRRGNLFPGAAKSAVTLWNDEWAGVATATEKHLAKVLKISAEKHKNLRDQISHDWTKINEAVSGALSAQLKNTHKNFDKQATTAADLAFNYGNSFSNIQNVVYGGLSNVGDNVKAITSAFGIKFPHLALEKGKSLAASAGKAAAQALGFDTGGFVGRVGEKGKDLVHALLGRGEAVLNGAQQKIVEPALQMVYGMGLPELFRREKTPHHMATGGYVYPFGPGFHFAGTDMGVDFSGKGPIAAIGDATITRASPQNTGTGWPGQGDGGHGNRGALIGYQFDSGPKKGMRVYLAENIDPVVSTGKVRAGQVIARARGAFPFLETGWSSNAQASPTAAGHADQQTAAGNDFWAFLQGLAHGKIVGGGAAIGPSMLPHIKSPHVLGAKGAIKSIAEVAIKQAVEAANKFIDRQSGGGIGGGGKPTKGAMSFAQIVNLAKSVGMRNPTLMAHIAEAESSGIPSNTNSSGATGLWQILVSAHQDLARRFNPLTNARNNALAAKVLADANPSLSDWNPSRSVWGKFGQHLARGGFAGGIPFLGAFGRGGVVRADGPGALVIGENGPETAYVVPDNKKIPADFGGDLVTQANKDIKALMGKFAGFSKAIRDLTADNGPLTLLTDQISNFRDYLDTKTELSRFHRTRDGNVIDTQATAVAQAQSALDNSIAVGNAYAGQISLGNSALRAAKKRAKDPKLTKKQRADAKSQVKTLTKFVRGLGTNYASQLATISQNRSAFEQAQVDSVNNEFDDQNSILTNRISNATAQGRSDLIPALISAQGRTASDQISKLTDKLHHTSDPAIKRAVQNQIDSLKVTVVQTSATLFQTAEDQINSDAGLSLNAANRKTRIADVMQRSRINLSDASFALRGSALRDTGAALGTQRAGIANLLAVARLTGNKDKVKELTDAMGELDTQIAENTQAQVDNNDALRQSHIDAISNRGSFLTGVVGSAIGAIQSLGQVAGITNNSLIGKLLTGNAGNISSTIGGLLGQFNSLTGVNLSASSPESLISSLVGLSNNFDTSNMTTTQQDQFRALIQAIIDNEGALAQNTEQLKELNNPTDQSFSSASWLQFRQAVFNGTGGLLPKFANLVPQMATGGYVMNSGLAGLHAGEVVYPAKVVSGGGGFGGDTILNITSPTEVADPLYLSRRLAFEMKTSR